METALLNPIEASIQYQGQFVNPAFSLFRNRYSLFGNLFHAFEKYGVSLRDLKAEAPDLAGAQISCSLLNFNVAVKIKIDILDISITNLAAVSEERAYQIVIDTWKATNLSDESVQIGQHAVTISSHYNLPKISYQELLERYVRKQENLQPQTESGVVFYLVPDSEKGINGGTIVLDRSVLGSGRLFLKAAVIFDASMVSIENLRSSFENFHSSHLAALGLEIHMPEVAGGK